MAAVNLPELVVSTYAGGLETLAHSLSLSEKYAQENGIDPDSFFDARLVDDQLPLSFQIQFLSQGVQLNLGRLEGKPLDRSALWADDEKTFQDLRKRVDRTIELVKSFDLANAQNTDFGKDFEFNFKGASRKTPLHLFLVTHVLPNFYFHLSTSYQFLRAKGVPLGKKDWLGGFLGI